MSALANQLALVRDALLKAEHSDPRDGVMSEALLTELIAAERVKAAPDDAAGEIDWIERFDREMAAIRAPCEHIGTAEADFDMPALAHFLSDHNGAPATIMQSRTVSAGMSKKTVLITIDGAARLPARMALRVDRGANNYLGTTVVEEFDPLRFIWEGGARIPRPWLLEPTGTVIGDPFIVSDHVDGAPVGSIYFPPAGPNPELLHDVAQCMAELHGIAAHDWPDHRQPRGDAFFDAQLDQHRADWTALSATSAIMDRAFDWIQANRTLAYGPPAIVHDDFAFNNMLVKDNRVAAVVDWEFAHVGTAAADIAYLWYAAEHMNSFAGFLDAYAASGGMVPPAEQLEFYRLWGQLRLGVMGFKAVRNFEEGKFDHVRFAMCLVARRMALQRIGRFLQEKDAI